MEENKQLATQNKEVTIEVLQTSFKSLRDQNVAKFKLKIAESIEAHPFVEITDEATAKQAKANRTALKSTRKEIENGDKALASAFSAERKEQTKIKNELVEEVKPYEEKQQAEIDRWEKIKAEKKAAKEKAEQERKAKHEATIADFVKKSKELINGLTIENTVKVTNDLILLNSDIDEEDLEEYEITLEDAKEELKELFEAKKAELQKEEQRKKELLEAQQLAKFNEVKAELLNFSNTITAEEDPNVKVTEYINSQSQFIGKHAEQLPELMEKTISDLKLVVIQKQEQAKKDAELQRLQAEARAKEEAKQKIKEEKEQKLQARLTLLEEKGFTPANEEKTEYELKGYTQGFFLAVIENLPEEQFNAMVNSYLETKNTILEQEKADQAKKQAEAEQKQKQENEERAKKLASDKIDLNAFVDGLQSNYIANELNNKLTNDDSKEALKLIDRKFNKFLEEARLLIEKY